MEQGMLHLYLSRWYREGKEKWFDLYLPGRGIVSGKGYVEQQRAYFYKKHCDGFGISYPLLGDNVIDLPSSGVTHAVSDTRWVTEQQKEGLNEVFDRWVLNLPDATPCHSSGT